MIKKLHNFNFVGPEPSDPPKNYISIAYRNNVKNRIREKDVSLEYKMNVVLEGQSSHLSVNEICMREGISVSTFQQWTRDFLEIKGSKVSESPQILTKTDKFKIVIEGKTGETSIAEICRRENIDQDEFLSWTLLFLEERRLKLKEFEIVNSPVYLENKQIISERSSARVFNYLDNYLDFGSNGVEILLNSDDISSKNKKNIDSFVSLQRINDVRYINKFFEKVNLNLSNDGIFVGCFETLSARRLRKKIINIPVINGVYFSFEFLFKRIMPKISFTKKYYFDITKGSDRLLSKAEGLGRLVSCGFKIMDFKTIDGLLYFVVKKVSEPNFDMSPSYGPLYKMPRLGKNGKIIGVYKFRTMHPYSEYLQDYIVSAHGYAKSGKPANDFRIPKWGKFMRKFWLDELPQLINVLKGELKLVGVRPESRRYFEDIPTEMQKLRMTQIPGCIPPYVALNRSGNVLSVLQAEKEYLEEKIRNPYFTDLKYFFLAIFCIVFKNKRSA